MLDVSLLILLATELKSYIKATMVHILDAKRIVCYTASSYATSPTVSCLSWYHNSAFDIKVG